MKEKNENTVGLSNEQAHGTADHSQAAKVNENNNNTESGNEDQGYSDEYDNYSPWG